MTDTPTGFGILSALVWAPLVGAAIVLLIPESFKTLARWISLGVTVITFLISLTVLQRFNGASFHFQMVEFIPWMDRLGIHYRLGVDGISIWLILLTTFLSAVSVWFSFTVDKRVKTYMACLLLLETAMLGVFVSLDMILFFTFFELTLIPMYFLIAIWGGENRAYASMKFFLFTAAGSIFMLIGMIAMQQLMKQQTGITTFSIVEIQDAVANGKLWVGSLTLQALVFWSFAVAFMVKCPMFPFHTWLPDAHTEAPTAGSIILAGVLLKMGTYGFLRFCIPMFPDAAKNAALPIMVLAVVGIVYGAIVATMQPDIKRLVAYSSVSHMGFVAFGIFSLSYDGLMGGSFQQLAHGISTGALFLLVGLIYERRHTRLFKEFGGLKAQMPIYAAIFLIVMLSSVGLPGTNGFIGEFLALLGGFQSTFNQMFGMNVWLSVIAGTGVILAAVYLLWMFQKTFYGPNVNPENRRLRDLKKWEIVLCGTLLVFIFWGGLYPNTFLHPMESSVGAARMMALNAPGMRPSWKDLSGDIDRSGNFVEVAERTQEMIALPFEPIRIIAPADLYFGSKSGPTTISIPRESAVAMQNGAMR